MINLRTREEVKKIQKACIISAKALELAGSMCEDGVNTFEIDEAVRKFIISENARPNFLNYNGYPRSCCISVNDMVIHGIPTKRIILKRGDIVSIDVGAEYDGYNGDNAYTFVIGEVPKEVEKFVSVTENSLYNGIERALEGNRVGDISHAIEEYATKHHMGVVRELVGHGVGTDMHEDPEVPNYGKAGSGPLLKEGMVIAVEPMLTYGKRYVCILDDDWTIVTADGEPSAHYEHTVVVTKDGYEILTKR